MVLSPIVFAATLAGGPVEGGISDLADRLRAAIDSRFAGAPGHILAVNDGHVALDIAEAAVGARLDRMTTIAHLYDPRSLAPIGSLREPCGQVVVRARDAALVLGDFEGDAECPPPAPGDPVQWPQGPFTIAVAAGDADPSLEALVRLLAAILPERLRLTGRFVPVPRAAAIDSPPDPDRLQVDAAVRINAARSASRVHVLVEISARVPRLLRDAAQIDAPLVPEMLWRRQPRGTPSPYGMASLPVDGEILALGVRTLANGAELLALTEVSLLRLSWQGTPRLDREVDFSPLAPARSKTRIPGGSLSVGEDGRACFATTSLADGWCQSATGLVPIPGVPLDGPDGSLLLAQFIAGTNVLDGRLKSTAGIAVADIGPFLRAKRDAAGLLVYRGTARLERWESDLRRSRVIRDALGDAWVQRTDGARIESSPAAGGGPDALVTVGPAGPVARDAVSGDIVALAVLDVDGDGRDEIAVATSVGRRASRLTIFAQD